MGPTKEVDNDYKFETNSRMVRNSQTKANSPPSKKIGKSHTLIDISTKRQLRHKRLAFHLPVIHLRKHDRNRDEQLRLRTLCRLSYNNFKSIFNADARARV